MPLGLPSEYILLSATFYTSCRMGSWEEVRGTASLTLRDATGQAEIQGDPKRGRELGNARVSAANCTVEPPSSGGGGCAEATGPQLYLT